MSIAADTCISPVPTLNESECVSGALAERQYPTQKVMRVCVCAAQKKHGPPRNKHIVMTFKACFVWNILGATPLIYRLTLLLYVTQ